MRIKAVHTIGIHIKARPSFKRRLDAASVVLETTVSDILREAADEKIDALAKENPKLRAALSKLDRAASV